MLELDGILSQQISQDVAKLPAEYARGNAAAATTLALREVGYQLGYEPSSQLDQICQGETYGRFTGLVTGSNLCLEDKVFLLQRTVQAIDADSQEPLTGRTIVLGKLRSLGNLAFRESSIGRMSSAYYQKATELELACRRRVPHASMTIRGNKLMRSRLEQTYALLGVLGKNWYQLVDAK